MFLHWLFGPHGDGLQGSSGTLGPGGGSSLHWKNGSPVKLGGHMHVGI